MIHRNTFIVESRSGDILTQVSLWELYQNTQALFSADEKGALAPKDLPEQSYLYNSFDLDTNRPILGVITLADEVQRVLSDPSFGSSLESATDDQIKLAVDFLFSNPETRGLRDTLSVEAASEKRVVNGIEIDYWTSPALFFSVLADNQKLGGGTSRSGIAVDDTILDKEEFNRNVQEILRGDETTYKLWGIAIDQNLEAEDEGTTAGMFIIFTVVAAVAVVGISLRSYWATALTGVGLGALMIWLKGFSNLVGIKSDLVVDLIVPIAMISLGVDFVVHAVRRYQEEKTLGYPPRRALAVGLAAVMGALLLAMLSDGIAFLSNTSSEIEAVIHFGIAAGIAVASSFVVLGVVVPLVMMRIDALTGTNRGPKSRAGRLMTLANSIGVAVLAGTGVILLVAISPVAGIVVLLAMTIGFVVVPFVIIARRNRAMSHTSVPEIPVQRTEPSDARAGWVVSVVTGLARYRPVVLLAAAELTAASVFFAFKLDPTFDIKDLFDSNSDFVISLDKLDEHIGERGGEPAVIFVKGDLTDPDALAAIQGFVAGLANNPYVAKNADGEPAIFDLNILNMLEKITGNEYAIEQVQQTTGVEITDEDADGIPDSREQVSATYDYILQNGVPQDEETLVFKAGEVSEVLSIGQGSQEALTILVIGIPGTREQTIVKSARQAITSDLDVLRGSPQLARVGLTGSPFARDEQLNATTKTLQTSLPLAAAASLVLLLIAMRSLRYAVVTVIPIGLVVAWLYGLMQIGGFSLNFVTATIGAVSIGVGIDYSIHMTERFREELGRADNRMEALAKAANGTGVALLASAASSIVGFAIMGFAPMPLFSTYGMLTAIMIFFALAASLIVLPSLLLVVTPENQTQEARNKPAPSPV